MKWISIQIQPSATSLFDQKKFLQHLAAVGRYPEIDCYKEKDKVFLTFHLFTENPVALWKELKEKFFNGSDYGNYMRSIAIVACEDENETEILLLHHFDPAEQLDNF